MHQSELIHDTPLAKADRDAGSLVRQLSTLTFNTAEQRLVDYLLSVEEYQLAAATAAELAARTGTSRSTVDRLARRLGFTGLKDFRRALLQDSRSMRTGVRTGPTAHPALASSDRPADVALKVLGTAAARATRFAEILASAPDLDLLVDAMDRAGQIQVFGAGASAVVGLDMYQRLLRLGLPIQFAEDTHTQTALAALMPTGAVAIAISYSGRTRTTLRAAEIARGRGAVVAAILGVAGSPLGELADIRLIMPPGVSLFGSDAVMTRILEMMLNEVLFHALALRSPALLQNARDIEGILMEERIPIPRTRT